MKQKCLITGSGGCILNNLIRNAIYEKKDYEFVSIDKVKQTSVLNNIYSNKNHTFCVGDVSDEHFVNVIFEYERPDIVIHGAEESTADNLLIQSNVFGTQIVAKASVKWGVKKFIYVSTDKVYGQLNKETDQAWAETSQIDPRNLFAVSKASAEMIVKSFGYSSGLNYCIARLSNNYGPRQSVEKLIPKTIKNILNNTKIQLFGQGNQIRNWTHIFDSSSALLKIIECGANNEIYNVSANQEFTNLEVVNEICNIMEKGFNLIEFVEDYPGHDFRYAMDSSKIRNLGWKHNFKLKPGLTNTIQWCINNNYLLK